jgi:hypothetical protein
MGIKMEKGNSLPCFLSKRKFPSRKQSTRGKSHPVRKMKRKFPSRDGKSGYSLWETGISQRDGNFPEGRKYPLI